MKDPEASLAAIRAAGDDFEVLARCVKEAEWLESTPGNHRQQYRAAKANLREIYRSLKKQAEEDKAKGIVRRAYDAEAEFPRISTTWEDLKWRMKAMPGGATKKHELFYDLYGLFSQATKGDNVDPQPVWAASGGARLRGALALGLLEQAEGAVSGGSQAEVCHDLLRG